MMEHTGGGWILERMTPSPARPRHLASSPFRVQPEPDIPTFQCGDLVNHDTHGVGRVISTEAHAVTVDFRSQKVRIVSPFRKMTML